MIIIGKSSQETGEDDATIEILPSNKFHVSFSELQNVLLPPPYSTQCLDYDTVGDESQEDCFDQCITKVTN